MSGEKALPPGLGQKQQPGASGPHSGPLPSSSVQYPTGPSTIGGGSASGDSFQDLVTSDNQAPYDPSTDNSSTQSSTSGSADDGTTEQGPSLTTAESPGGGPINDMSQFTDEKKYPK
jgi:hypothetical protein